MIFSLENLEKCISACIVITAQYNYQITALYLSHIRVRKGNDYRSAAGICSRGRGKGRGRGRDLIKCDNGDVHLSSLN
jgi:hypothetical protein